jgi:hypothetical protein
MLAFLGANVGDHLQAAVTNVLGDGRQHFEQAIFADELSKESIEATRELITRQWQSLRSDTVPALEELIHGDREAGRPQDQRIRIGLYTWTEGMPGGTSTGHPEAARDENRKPPASTPQAPKSRPARTRRKEGQ